jgi:hypothetical protein
MTDAPLSDRFFADKVRSRSRALLWAGYAMTALGIAAAESSCLLILEAVKPIWRKRLSA